MMLRRLEEKDAPLMLEWMHDEDIVRNMKADFKSKTIEDCENFISAATRDYDIIAASDDSDSDGAVEKLSVAATGSRDDRIGRNLHLAITDSSDEYLGTVSLKHIEKDSAEFGITIRKKAMGHGVSISAMNEILKIGFEKLGLSNVFWCVNPENVRALKFYDKNGFDRVELSDTEKEKLIDDGVYNISEISNYIWYQVVRK